MSTHNDRRSNARDYSRSNRAPAPIAANWLGALGIRDGEWFIEAKLKLQRGMKARCLGEPGRAWCWLALHTSGFQSEAAVKQVAGKIVPATLTDLASETGIKKQNCRRAILQLKAWGIADIQGDRQDTRLFGWAKPRPVDAAEVKRTGDPLAAVPDEWRKYFRRFKIQPAPGFEAARDYWLRVEADARSFLGAADKLRHTLKECTARDYSAVIPRGENEISRDDALQRNEEEQEKNSAGQSVSQSQVDRPESPPGRLAAQGKSLRPIHTWLLEQLGGMLPGEPGPTVCAETESAIGDMPRDELMRLFRARDRNLVHYGWGLVPRLAEEARKGWDRYVARLGAQATGDGFARERAIEQATRTLADPSADERTRALAREILEQPDAPEGV